MNDARKNVLIGDGNPDRASSLEEILENDFLADVVCVESYFQVMEEVKDTQKNDFEWDLVLLAEDLRYTRKGEKVFPRPFYTIKEIGRVFNLVCFGSNPNQPEVYDDKLKLNYICVLPPPLTPQQRQAVINNLEGFLTRASIPEIKPEDDASLREQVRSLSTTRDFDEGKKILGRLIYKFNLPVCNKIIVAKLSQGLSGAKVFRFRLDPPDSVIGEQVLKLNPASNLWKFDFEIKGHVRAKDSLGNSRYKTHIPDSKPVEKSDPVKHIVSHGNWCAIRYDYLGGDIFGKFIDLEKTVVASPEKLQDAMQGLLTSYGITKSFIDDPMGGRIRLLEILLEWLCQNWYSKPNLWKRDKKNFWDYQDGSDRSYVEFPPYRLSGKNKMSILDFLDSRDAAMGARFFDDWADRLQRVRYFIAVRESELSPLYSLHNECSVILSPAHGDMNSNNLLLWLDQRHPFLIDFPFYQESGHALQDFARLEVEIKFALMDRQEGSPKDKLPALEHTHSQTPLWQALENHLIKSESMHWPTGCFEDNVRLSLELINLVRAKAEQVQAQGEDDDRPQFFDEYRPPLLYHTLRAIGYRLPIFKRLLAVYSAAELLSQCDVSGAHP